MGYVFTIITENDPDERYNVLGTCLVGNYEGIAGKLTVSVLDESENKIAIFRNVKAVNSVDESMLTQNEIRKMIGPQLPLVLKPIKDEGIVKVAPVQQEEPQKEKAPKDEKAPKEARGQQASKNSIDYGKVWALRKAGWPVKEICAEMKISDASVYIICKKMKALEEATKNADH